MFTVSAFGWFSYQCSSNEIEPGYVFVWGKAILRFFNVNNSVISGIMVTILVVSIAFLIRGNWKTRLADRILGPLLRKAEQINNTFFRLFIFLLLGHLVGRFLFTLVLKKMT